jgi:hypothetical protein
LIQKANAGHTKKINGSKTTVYQTVVIGKAKMIFQVLENLEINDYEHLLLLSYQDNYRTQQADAKTLITLLHSRNIGEKWGMVLNIVSEMLDMKNRELASIIRLSPRKSPCPQLIL